MWSWEGGGEQESYIYRKKHIIFRREKRDNRLDFNAVNMIIFLV